jgi:5-methylcytosine-specific restriction endonuclease McrA
MRYEEYIKSPEWTAKSRKLRQEITRCQLCNRNSLQLHVHHNTYKRLGNEAQRDLIVLCEECHNLFSLAYQYDSKIGVHYPKVYQMKDIFNAIKPPKRKRKKHI